MVDSVASPNWRVEFGISNELFQQWKSSRTAATDSFLQWCLKTGQIQGDLYLDWASVHHELPIVQADYFAIPPDIVFWNAIKDQHKWTESFFPLAEWDGVLAIGCLEPPADFSFKSPHIFVLASQEDLKKLWLALDPLHGDDTATIPATESPNFTVVADENSEINHQGQQRAKEESSPPTPAFDAPEGFNFNSSAVRDIKTTEFGLSLDNTSNATPEKNEKSQVTDVPYDLSLAKLPIDEIANITASLDFRNLIEEKASAPGKKPETKENKEKPAAQKIAAKNEKPEIKTAPSTSVKDEQPVSQPQKDSGIHEASSPTPSAKQNLTQPTTPQAPPVASKMPPAETSATAQPQPPPLHRPPSVQSVAQPPTPVTDETSQVDEETGTASKVFEFTITGFTSPRRSDSPVHPRIISPEIEEKSLDSCLTYDDLGEQALIHCLNSFEHSIIFLFQGGELRPWKWTNGLHHSDPENPQAIDLTSPSIFRIVFQTRLPYHGYVVPNGINNLFINSFFGDHIPNQVTLVPINLDHQIGGMLMGTTDAVVDYKSSLRTMELLADEVVNNFLRLRQLKTRNAS